MERISLDGKWQFKALNAYGTLPSDKRGVAQWMEGAVPGTVHTDLLANNQIPDPFYRMNENDVQWVDSQRWVYRRRFVVPPDFLEHDAVHLVAEGLDTYAQLFLNGKKVAQTSNMFVQHRFDVKAFLQSGENTIEVIFDSPLIRSKSFEKNYPRLYVSHESHRVYVRKAQYAFGWDWGPKLATSGIWRPIYLEGSSLARLFDPFVEVILSRNQEAVVQCSVGVERFRRAVFDVHVQLVGADISIEREVRVVRNVAKFTLRIPHPRLWWPNGYGDQPMYTATFALLHKGRVLDATEIRFAIRRIRLLQEKGRGGKSFVFEINGRKVFCKGADWIPCDSFLPRISDSIYEHLLRMAKDAHMNMIRVWGGGIYERDIFYDLCDRLGLMVWQDFMYACGEYPEEPWFLEQVKDEGEKIVKRLRNHPSVVIWCGNNECEWLFCKENPGKSPDDMNGATIFREILPKICKLHDGTRPYWRSSPFGEGFPNAESNGNHHQWDVWSSWKDFKEYENDEARFVTEFGFQAPGNRQTLDEVTLPSDRHPQALVMEHHNKQVEGPERLYRFQAAHHLVSECFDAFIYKSQLVQAEALKCGVEHWRRRKFDTAGALFWQLNDCWPVTSWSVIDHALRPKVAYYYAKKFFAPILVSFKATSSNMEVWVTNDLVEPVRGDLTITLRSFEGNTVWTRSSRIVLSPNVSRAVHRVRNILYDRCDPTTHYLHAQLWLNGMLTGENRWFFVEPKHLHLPRPKVTATVQNLESSTATLEVSSDKFAKNVRVEVEGEDALFDDNYFDIDPGDARVIRLTSQHSIGELGGKIKLWWLNQEVR